MRPGSCSFFIFTQVFNSLKIAYWYILRQYLGPFVLTFFIALFVLILQWLWLYIDDLVGKGIEWYYIAELFIYASAHFVPMALPLAVLLSGLMTMGNLGENYELVAFKAAGISLLKVLKPLIFFSIFLSIVAFLFSNYLLPVANLKMNTLFYDIREQKPAIDIKPHVFYGQIDGYVIRVEEKVRRGKTDLLKQVMIYDHTKKNGNTTVLIADSGIMSITPDKMNAIMTLYHGCVYYEDVEMHKENPVYPFYKRCFEENILYFDLSEFKLSRSSEDIFRDHYQMMNISQLADGIDSFTTRVEKDMDDLRQQYFRPLANVVEFPDSTTRQRMRYYRDTIIVTSFDSLFSHMPFNDQLILLNTALGKIRSASNRAMIVGDITEMNRQNIVNYTIEWHRKFTLSVACLILFFIGAPLGSIIRKGGLGVPVVVSVILFIFFHIISISGEKMAKEEVIPVAWGMWLPILVYLPLGIFFTLKATADSSLFVIENYIVWLKKLNPFDWLRNFSRKKESIRS